MCLYSSGCYWVTKKGFNVYKLAVKGKTRYHFPFRNLEGREIGERVSGKKILSKMSRMDLAKIIPAVNFHAGMGYMTFTSKKAAYEYSEYMSGMFDMDKVVIVKIRVPSNTRYERGVIKNGYKGSGIDACRSEYLDCSNVKEIGRVSTK